MEINAKEARNKISALLDLTQKGEEISIFRRGKKVALLVPPDRVRKRLPDLNTFRETINIKGKPLSQTVKDLRTAERY